MKVRVITLQYSEALGGFPEEALQAAHWILRVREEIVPSGTGQAW